MLRQQVRYRVCRGSAADAAAVPQKGIAGGLARVLWDFYFFFYYFLCLFFVFLIQANVVPFTKAADSAT